MQYHCIYKHTHVIKQIHIITMKINIRSTSIIFTKARNTTEEGSVSLIRIGVNHHSICIPGNSTLTVPRKTTKLNTNCSHLLELAALHNFTKGLVVNPCYITSNARKVLVILINPTDHNICTRQPFTSC